MLFSSASALSRHRLPPRRVVDVAGVVDDVFEDVDTSDLAETGRPFPVRFR